MLFALRPISLPDGDFITCMEAYEYYESQLDLFDLLNPNELKDNEFLDILFRLYSYSFGKKEEIIASMLRVPEVQHQSVEFKVKGYDGSCPVELYSETGDYGNAIIPDMATFKKIVTGKNISKNPYIVTGWSNSKIGRELLNARDMDENIALWNMLGKNDASLNDLEFYKDLIVAMIKREFTPERIASDVICYINMLKGLIAELRYKLETSRLLVASSVLEFKSFDLDLSRVEDRICGIGK